MSSSKLYPYSLVLAQFACLVYIAISAPLISESVTGILIEVAGIFLGIHAIYIIKLKNISIAPLVKPNSSLITSGPYRIIRHPMYTAQLLAILPLVVEYFSYIRLSVLFLLLITLLIKIQFEEKQLNLYFPDYKEYSSKTWRMLPFVF